MTKEEKIKECWGANYEAFKEHIDENGIAIYPYFQKHEMIEDVRPLDLIGSNFRPKSLRGIENNNGWIKIESEADLPEYGYYEVIKRNTGEHIRASLNNEFRTTSLAHYYSHYKPIVKIDLPLY